MESHIAIEQTGERLVELLLEGRPCSDLVDVVASGDDQPHVELNECPLHRLGDTRQSRDLEKASLDTNPLIRSNVALVLGAAHAVLPGHGKTVMAAYLAGRRGRPGLARCRCQAASGQQVTLQQVVSDAPDGEVKYYFKLDGGSAQVGLGEAADAEATITQNYETAVAIVKQELNAQNAFMQGKLKISGNMMKLMQLQGVFNAMPKAAEGIDVEY